jgi:hypothetical protein
MRAQRWVSDDPRYHESVRRSAAQLLEGWKAATQQQQQQQLPSAAAAAAAASGCCLPPPLNRQRLSEYGCRWI